MSGKEKFKKSVFIVDDHPVVRQGLTQFINGEDDLYVCGDAEDANGAIKGINSCKPDIVIADISLKGISGIELTAAIKSRFNIPVLILSMHDENVYAERAIRAGASGYIMKKESMEKVIFAIHEVLKGKIYLHVDLKERLLSKLLKTSHEIESPLECLTNREIEVFRLIGLGLSTKLIARELALSVKTIETYRERIKRKLDLKDSAELIQYAVQWGLRNNGSR